MSIPQRIRDLANKVRNEIYGKDVRESIAQSIEVSGETAEEAKNRSVEQTERVDHLIRENPQPSEVVDARGNYPILRDRLNSVDANLAQTAEKQTNYMQHFSQHAPYVVEKRGEEHSAGFPHTAFFGGCNFRGKEIYAGRSSENHMTTATRGVIVGYIRNYDGTFTPRILVPASGVDPRDINLSPTRDESRLFLTATVVLNDSSANAIYETYLWELDENLNIVGNRRKLFDGFGWGNTLVTPTGRVIKTRYTSAEGREGVELMRSANHFTSLTLTSEKAATIFPQSSESPTECTIGYWNNKLVAISRQDNGNALYRETSNLEGTDGWGDIINLGYEYHAPAIQPYNNDKTLLATVSWRVRDTSLPYSPRVQALVGTDNGYDWTPPTPLNNFSGNYGTIVPNRYGFGNMFYREFDGGVESEIYHMDIDSEQVLRINDIPKLNKMIKQDKDGVTTIGNAMAFNFFDTSNERMRYIYFIPKQDIKVAAFKAYTKNLYNIDPAQTAITFQRKDGDAFVNFISVYPTNIPDMNSEPAITDFRFSTALTFLKGQLYRLRLQASYPMGMTGLYNNNRTHINLDLGVLIYHKTTAVYGSAEAFENVVYPLEFEIVD